MSSAWSEIKVIVTVMEDSSGGIRVYLRQKEHRQGTHSMSIDEPHSRRKGSPIRTLWCFILRRPQGVWVNGPGSATGRVVFPHRRGFPRSI